MEPEGTYIIDPEASPIVAREEPRQCPRCKSDKLIQDPDVLDTWFSSALWPFSTLGWPEKTRELQVFYPTSCLVTSFDILFFWVARMIMMGLKFMGEIPFCEVYIHALVLDAEGQKMSKSRGNVIDPLDMINRYGADSLRFTLAALAAQGRGIKLSSERVEGYRHFCNKLWNAYRFVALHLNAQKERFPYPVPLVPDRLTLADHWILSRLQETIASTTEALSVYRFNEAAQGIYQFIWHEYCDWYLEIVKSRLSTEADEREKRMASSVLISVLEVALRLLHPFMPFITEKIWQKLPFEGTRPPSIMVAQWPSVELAFRFQEAEGAMELLIELTRAVRNIRSEMNISPSKVLRVVVRTSDPSQEAILREGVGYLRGLAKCEVEYGPHLEKPFSATKVVVRGMEVYIPLKGVIDFEEEKERLLKELGKLTKELERVERRLSTKEFLTRAPAEVVAKEQAARCQLMETQSKLKEHLGRIEAYLADIGH